MFVWWGAKARKLDWVVKNHLSKEVIFNWRPKG